MEVVEVKGTKVTAKRGELKRTRNIEKFKILKQRQPSTNKRISRLRTGKTDDEEEDWLEGFTGNKRREEKEQAPEEQGGDQGPPGEVAGAGVRLQEQARPESETSSPPLQSPRSADQAQQGGPQHQVITEFGPIDANSTFLMVTTAEAPPSLVEDLGHQLVDQRRRPEAELEETGEDQAARPRRKRKAPKKYPEEKEMEHERDADGQEERMVELQVKEERNSPETSMEGSKSNLGLLLEQAGPATTPTPALTPQPEAAALSSSAGPPSSGNWRDLSVTQTNRDPRMLDRGSNKGATNDQYPTNAGAGGP